MKNQISNSAKSSSKKEVAVAVSNVEKANVETVVAEQIEIGDLESSEDETPETEKNVNFSNPVWLAEHNPFDYFSPEVSTKKLNLEREILIFDGLKSIAKISNLVPEFKVNPLVVLLGMWWEVKPARIEIKKMIMKDAKTMGLTSDVYIQKTLKAEVEKLDVLKNASQRLSYAINYFKPRRELDEKVAMQQIKINGIIYEVGVAELISLKELYTDKNELREEVLKVAIPVSQNEVESL